MLGDGEGSPMKQTDGNILRPRRRELELMGIVEDSGKTALTRSGRSAVIWKLVKAAP